jgi:hypothetical protein
MGPNERASHSPAKPDASAAFSWDTQKKQDLARNLAVRNVKVPGPACILVFFGAPADADCVRVQP